MAYDGRKAAWDRAVSAEDAPPRVYVRIEDEVCTLQAGKAAATVDPALALEHGVDVWAVVRQAHPGLWPANPPRRRVRS